MPKKRSKYEPKTKEERDSILLSIRELIKDQKIERGAANKVAEKLSIEKKIVDFVLKEVKSLGEFDGFQKKIVQAKTKKKAARRKYNFKNHKAPSELIQKWLNLKKGDPRTKDKFFWGRESKIFKRVFENYPDEFIETLNFPRIDSMLILDCEFYKKLIKQKYYEFTYKSPKKEDKPEISEEKIGEKAKINKRKNIKSFLNNGKTS